MMVNKLFSVILLTLLTAPMLSAAEAPILAPRVEYTWQLALADAAKADQAIAALAPLAEINDLKPDAIKDAGKKKEAEEAQQNLRDLRAKREKAIANAKTLAANDAISALRSAFESGVRDRRIEEFRAFMNGELPTDDAAAVKLSDSLLDFVKTWNPLYAGDASVDNRVLTAVTAFLPFSTPDQVRGRPAPYQPFDSAAQKAQFEATMRKFAAFVPGKRTAALCVSGAEYQKRALYKAINNNDPMAIRACVNALVDDLNKVYGELEITLALRQALVSEYSKATKFGATGIWAAIFAIFGSLVLFGGLAWALYKAASSKDPEEPIV